MLAGDLGNFFFYLWRKSYRFFFNCLASGVLGSDDWAQRCALFVFHFTQLPAGQPVEVYWGTVEAVEAVEAVVIITITVTVA